MILPCPTRKILVHFSFSSTSAIRLDGGHQLQAGLLQSPHNTMHKMPRDYLGIEPETTSTRTLVMT